MTMLQIGKAYMYTPSGVEFTVLSLTVDSNPFNGQAMQVEMIAKLVKNNTEVTYTTIVDAEFVANCISMRSLPAPRKDMWVLTRCSDDVQEQMDGTFIVTVFDKNPTLEQITAAIETESELGVSSNVEQTTHRTARWGNFVMLGTQHWVWYLHQTTYS